MTELVLMYWKDALILLAIIAAAPTILAFIYGAWTS